MNKGRCSICGIEATRVQYAHPHSWTVYERILLCEEHYPVTIQVVDPGRRWNGSAPKPASSGPVQRQAGMR